MLLSAIYSYVRLLFSANCSLPRVLLDKTSTWGIDFINTRDDHNHSAKLLEIEWWEVPNLPWRQREPCLLEIRLRFQQGFLILKRRILQDSECHFSRLTTHMCISRYKHSIRYIANQLFRIISQKDYLGSIRWSYWFCLLHTNFFLIV